MSCKQADYRIPSKRTDRLEEMRQTRLQLLAKRRAKAARIRRSKTSEAAYLRYRAKLNAERAELELIGKSPYDRAVARVERLTGVPASLWEWKLDHPYVRVATRAAKVLAGLERAA